MSYELPCEECVKTSNHCCLADVRLGITELMIMLREAKRLKKDFVFGPMDEGFNTFIIIPRKEGIDITREPCLFFGSDGKCEIYEHRPSACRLYGTKNMRCRYEVSGIKTKEEIEKLSVKDIRELDVKSFESSIDLIDTYKDKMVNFNLIKNEQ